MSSKQELGDISFDLPKNQSNVIKVIGVGGGGSNAINYMFQQGIKGVDFVICNTDAQALQNSGVPNKIQLGLNLTEGLGAGANPEVGEKSAVESFEDIQRMLDTNTKMIFITAGMGGGTGTGAAPIIAKMARELNILTVGIVTMPFQFEGKMRCEQAQIGIENLRNQVDSLIVINNNKLREVYGNLGFKAGFAKADEVLSTAARGIAEVITHHYTQNIDLRDAKTVLSDSGTAIMGSATSAGQNRAHEAIISALDSPLLNDNKITGAKNVLLLIVSGTQEITIDEIGEINDHIQNEAGHGANIIMGVGDDAELGEAISVTIIATGFNIEQQDEITNTEVKKVIHSLEDDQSMEQDLLQKEVEPAIIRPDIILETKEEIVRHTLDIEEDVEELSALEKSLVSRQTAMPEIDVEESMDLVPTTEIIKNMSVTYDEVLADKSVMDEEYMITSVEKEVIQEVRDYSEEEEQITLTFDLPLSTAAEEKQVETKTLVEEKVTFELDKEVKEIHVKDHIELIPVTEANEEGETRYVLEDYIELESSLNAAEPEGEIVFEKKVTAEIEQSEVPSEEVDPMNSPISALLKERADERRRKMKDFNYKFNSGKIEDIEKIPAYKRQGVDLEDSQHSSETNSSRTTLGTDENDDLQLRNNNSFLHDRPD